MWTNWVELWLSHKYGSDAAVAVAKSENHLLVDLLEWNEQARREYAVGLQKGISVGVQKGL